MAFDSGVSPEAWRFVIAVWAYPLFPLLLAIGAWVAYAFRKNRLSAVLTGLTFTPPVLFALFIWISSLIGPLQGSKPHHKADRQGSLIVIPHLIAIFFTKHPYVISAVESHHQTERDNNVTRQHRNTVSDHDH